MLSESDLIQHVVKFGIDVFPAIELPNERTRLNMFYEDAAAAYPKIFDKLTCGTGEFSVSMSGKGEGSSGPVFALTPRGPVFMFPLFAPQIGEVTLTADFVGLFNDLRQRFFSFVPGRKILRVGMVRELLFGLSPDADLAHLLPKTEDFASAHFVGGQYLAQYRDDLYNIRVTGKSGELEVQQRAPLGPVMASRHQRVFIVAVDVNNHEIRPLDNADITNTIEKACSLWPEQLLSSLNRGSEES